MIILLEPGTRSYHRLGLNDHAKNKGGVHRLAQPYNETRTSCMSVNDGNVSESYYYVAHVRITPVDDKHTFRMPLPFIYQEVKLLGLKQAIRSLGFDTIFSLVSDNLEMIIIHKINSTTTVSLGTFFFFFYPDG